MVYHMAKVVFLICLFALNKCNAYIASEKLAYDALSLEPRACPTNVARNGGFETGSLSSWNFTKIYQKRPPLSCTVIGTGDKSQHSAELYASSSPDDTGNGGTLRQTLSICKKVIYQVSWSVFQVKDQTSYNVAQNDYPSMYVNLFSPGAVSSTLLAVFDFFDNKYNSSDYSDQNPYATNPAGKWKTYTASFPDAEIGDWTLEFAFYDVASSEGKKPVTTRFRIDNVIVKPQV